MLIDFRPQSSTIVFPCWTTTVPSTVSARANPGTRFPWNMSMNDIRAGLNLGDARIGAGDVVGAGAAHGDDFAWESPPGASVSTAFFQVVHRLSGLVDPHFPVGLQHAMPFIALDAAETEARQACSGAAPARQPRQASARRPVASPRPPRSGPRARPPAAWTAWSSSSQFRGSSTATVRRPCRLAPGQGLDLVTGRRPGWRSRRLRCPARLMTMRLPDRRRADADGAGLDLQTSQLGAFVNLDVRAKLRG